MKLLKICWNLIFLTKKLKISIFPQKIKILTRASRFLRILRIFEFFANFEAKFWKTEKRYGLGFFFSWKYCIRSFIFGVKQLSVIICSKVTAFSNFAKKWQKMAKIGVFCPRRVKKIRKFAIFSFFLAIFVVFHVFAKFWSDSIIFGDFRGGGKGSFWNLILVSALSRREFSKLSNGIPCVY